MKISVISPVYENPEHLKRFLDSFAIAMRMLGSSCELIIVDDASSRDIKNVMKDYSFAKYIRLSVNSGPAKARNAGARTADGGYLVFFDSDVILKENTLKLFENHFRKGEEIVVGEYDSEPANKGFFPEFKSLIIKAWTPKACYVSVFALRAAGIKKSIFDEIGGFNENIKTASVEDYEFGDRLCKKGYKILYNPDILVRHYHPSFKKQCRVFYERSRDITGLLMRKGLRPYDWCASPAEGLSSISGTFFVLTLPLCVVSGHVLLCAASGVSFIVFLLSNLSFTKVVMRERGVLFLPAAIMVKLALCLPITAGFVVGCLLFLRRKLKCVVQKKKVC